MTSLLRLLLPIYIAEFLTELALWAFFYPTNTNAWSYLPFLIHLLILPFLAGYVVARASHTLRLRYCAVSGVSVSLASIAAAALLFIFQSQPGEYFISVAGYVLSTIFIAVVPQLFFGLLGGWVGRKGYAINGI